jgi:hypothetical protein
VTPPAGRRRRSLTDVIAQTAPDTAATAPPPAPAGDGKPWKYTLLLDNSDRDRAQSIEQRAVKLAGIRVTKQMRAAVFRALLAEADTDTDLLGRVAARLRDGAPS